MNDFDFHTLPNGMTLLGKPIEHVQSVSFQFLIPAGAACLPDGCGGAGNIICDWIFRGAGNRDSRQLMDVLEGLGILRHASMSAEHLAVQASLEAGNLADALDVFADILLRPALTADQFEFSRQQAINELAGLDDDPRSKVMLHVKEQFYPDPYGRSALGTMDELAALTAEKTADIVRQLFAPSQMIFSICGKYDFEAVCRQMEILFDADGAFIAPTILPQHHDQSYVHYPTKGVQVHIGLMTAVPPIPSGCYYELLGAVAVLSGSMSGRLFTEVREKRGLCYAVGARYRTMKEYAGISCYAGTTPEKAQQTLDVIREQFDQLKNGIRAEELQRAKVGLKTSLIMQCESTAGRAAGIARDHYLLGRVRTVEEIRDNIAALETDTIEQTLRDHPFERYTVVTIGPKAINV